MVSHALIPNSGGSESISVWSSKFDSLACCMCIALDKTFWEVDFREGSLEDLPDIQLPRT